MNQKQEDKNDNDQIINNLVEASKQQIDQTNGNVKIKDQFYKNKTKMQQCYNG
ncbi:hypothetical protein pb186bvf_013445 [Paramecium bursaria]